MAYTPELSQGDSATLRRVAWAMNLPMTKTMERVFETLVDTLDHKIICERCRDKTKCNSCAFSK